MIDNGGWSMDPYIEMVQTLFNYARSQFKDLKSITSIIPFTAGSGEIHSGATDRSPLRNLSAEIRKYV